MEKSPLVSVIVPVYNAEEYLRQCVESVLAQTYSHWELILVDDGSTDSSGSICQKAERITSKIKALYINNSGVSAARNKGLSMMRGKYVAFLDADDFLHPEFLETAVAKALATDADIVNLGIRRFKEESPALFLDIKPIPDSVKRLGNITHTGRKACLNTLYQKRNFEPSPCGKLFKAPLWDGERFRQGVRYEDLDKIPLIMLKASVVAHFPWPLYYYRQHTSSYLHTFSLARADVLKVTGHLRDSMADDPELLRAALDRQLSANFNILALIESHHSRIPETDMAEAERIAGECWRKIKELRGRSLRNPHVRLKNKAGIIVSYLGGRPLVRLLSSAVVGR